MPLPVCPFFSTSLFLRVFSSVPLMPTTQCGPAFDDEGDNEDANRQRDGHSGGATHARRSFHVHLASDKNEGKAAARARLAATRRGFPSRRWSGRLDSNQRPPDGIFDGTKAI
jgi:hypothetical protein